MEIELKQTNGIELIFTAENVIVCEDVEERIYPKKEDGSLDTGKNPERDVSDLCISQFTNILDDIIWSRKRKFDSSELIIGLFDKLPEYKQKQVLFLLHKDYSDILN